MSAVKRFAIALVPAALIGTAAAVAVPAPAPAAVQVVHVAPTCQTGCNMYHHACTCRRTG